MSDSVFYEVPELEECEHGIRNKKDCVMCAAKQKEEEKENA